jgi:hypothetical protein
MIRKNVKVGAVEGVTVLMFGFGDISIGVTEDPQSHVHGLSFIETEPREIGYEDPSSKGKSTDDIPLSVFMTFTDVRSVDVLIERLKNVRDRMTSVIIPA